MACVDSAIWDAVGKALDVPLYKLWGGYTDTLPIVCIAGYYEEGKTLADFGREMEQIRDAGFAGCKFKVGGRTPEEDADRVRAARSAVGDDFVLTIDANQGYTLRQAVDFSRRVEDQNIRWFEEPVRWFNDRIDMAARAQHDRHPGLRRAERDRPRRLPRPDDGGRHRRLQFRRELGRGADRMAARRRHGDVVRRRDGPPRGAADFGASPRLDRPLDVSGNLSSRPRPDVLRAGRQPLAVRQAASTSCRRAPGFGARSSTRRSLRSTASS